MVELIPRHSILAIDEAHSVLDSRLSGTYGLSSFEQLLAGLRKKDCKVFLASAMWQMIAPQVRSMTSELITPLKVNVDRSTVDGRRSIPPSRDRANFIVVAEHRGNFPFRRMMAQRQQNPQAAGPAAPRPHPGLSRYADADGLCDNGHI